MNARDRKKLTKNYVRLVAETPADSVADHLRQSGILTDELWEDIVYQNTEKNKVRQLISTLLRRGPEAFSTFVEALRAADCEELAERLQCS